MGRPPHPVTGPAEPTTLDRRIFADDLRVPQHGAKHSDEFRDALKDYIAHARKAGGSAPVRAWARENGYDIKDRGRAPAEVVAKYRRAAGQ